MRRRTAPTSEESALVASITKRALRAPPGVCKTTAAPLRSIATTRVRSQKRTPSPRAARASPQASRAVSTIAQLPFFHRPAKYVGKAISLRIIASSSHFTS
jgi:hypothetical protein